jgi:hypothetical protein
MALPIAMKMEARPLLRNFNAPMNNLCGSLRSIDTAEERHAEDVSSDMNVNQNQETQP